MITFSEQVKSVQEFSEKKKRMLLLALCLNNLSVCKSSQIECRKYFKFKASLTYVFHVLCNERMMTSEWKCLHVHYSSLRMAAAFQSTLTSSSLPSRNIVGSNHDHLSSVSSSALLRNVCLSKHQPRQKPFCVHQPNQFVRVSTKQTLTVTCAAVGTEDVDIEPTTNVKFSMSIHVPGSSTPLQLIGTGFREKKIAFIKVKVYAVGIYADPAISIFLSAWKGKSADELTKDPSFMKAASEAPVDKGIEIVLVRDVDGATFWEALNESLAPRIKALNGVADQDALKSFGNVFRNRSLKQGTSIYLTWVQPTKLEIAVSGDSSIPKSSEALIHSSALLESLFDVYLGENPVSPSAKASVLLGLKALL